LRKRRIAVLRSPSRRERTGGTLLEDRLVGDFAIIHARITFRTLDGVQNEEIQ
jgi:hypothetical protein